MMTTLRFLFLSIFLLPMALLAQIDVQHLDFNLMFQSAEKRMVGSVTYTILAKEKIKQLTLDAAFLQIEKIILIEANNKTPCKYQYDSQKIKQNLTIQLGKDIEKDQTLTLQIFYQTTYQNHSDPNNIGGSNGKGIRFLVPSSTEPNRRLQVWTNSEPDGSPYWFPSWDNLQDFWSTDMYITVQKPLWVVANGNLMSQNKNNNNTTTYHYQLKIPYQNHKTAFIISNYIDIKQSYKGVSLHNICYPDEKEATIATVERLPDMIRFFSEYTGVEYPYESYTQAFVQDLPWGVANTTLATHSENMVDDNRTHIDFLYLWDALEGESLASQWFGSSVGVGEWADVWLDKGLSRYLSWQYSEYKNGHDEFMLYRNATDGGTYFFDWNSGIRQPIVADIAPTKMVDFKFQNANYPYFRGSLVAHILRKHLGDENWKKTLKEYLTQNKDKTVTTKDLQKAAEKVSGERLDWFFNQWLYRQGHPVFEVTKSYDTLRKELSVSVRQVQKADTLSVAFFQGKMELEIDNKIQEVWISPKADNQYTFSLPTDPRLVHIDYENTWIKELTFEKTTDELLYQLANSRDIMGKRWALQELIKDYKSEKNSVTEKQAIRQGFITLLKSDIYWRMKFNVLGSINGLNMEKEADFENALLEIIKDNKAWVRSSALNLLGNTRKEIHADLYISYLSDESDRVINAAATALGKSNSPKAFDALVNLKNKPSWKNQSYISAMNGLRELKDKRALPIALHAFTNSEAPHWTLGTPTWDHRLAATEVLLALQETAKGYDAILPLYRKALQEDNINDIFYNLQQIVTLADPRGETQINELKTRYQKDENAMTAIQNWETIFKENTQK